MTPESIRRRTNAPLFSPITDINGHQFRRHGQIMAFFRYRKLLLATTNRGKADELRSLLGHLAADVLDLDQVGVELRVEEDGASYEENARKKALLAAEASGLPSIGDDSGIEIAGLGWRPGLLSARFYVGPWPDRLKQLIDSLRAGTQEDRKARFICVIALAEGDRVVAMGRGVMACRIAEKPAGGHGFGYDPVVVPEGYDVTISQMPAELKNRISHRALAAADLTSRIDRVLT